MDNNNLDNDNNLLNEALLDLVFILKKNNELINENNELRRKMEEKENDIKRYRNKKSNNH